MFKYTKAALYKTIDDIKKTARVFEFILAFFQIPFAIYNLATNHGIRAVNIAFLVISSTYFILYLIASQAISDATEKAERKKWKKIKSKAKRTAKWIKRPVQLYSIGVLIYGITIATEESNVISIILVFLQLITFLISFIVDILGIIIERKARFFIEAWQADWDNFKEPGRKIGNVVKTIFGKELTPKHEETKTEQILDEYLQQRKEQEEKEKRIQQEEKEREALLRKQQKQQEKLDKKLEKANQKAETPANDIPMEDTYTEVYPIDEIPELAIADDVTEPKKKKSWFSKN